MAGMPHTTAPSSIPLVLKAIQNATVPGKVTAAFVEANGIPAGEGGHVVGMLRSLGFIDGASRPTLIWNRYRRPDQAPVVLAGALRHAYAPLFDRYSDAPDRDLVSLGKVIRRHTEYSDHHVNRTAECFLMLCQHANFAVAVIAAAKSPASREIDLSPHERLLAMRRLTAAHHEALECARHGLNRPAHVSVWNGFTALALTMLASNDFAAVRAIRPSWVGGTIEDLSVRTTGELLLEMLSSLGLCDADEIDDLQILLQARDDAARPTFFTPTSEETGDYICDVVDAALALIGSVAEPA